MTDMPPTPTPVSGAEPNPKPAASSTKPDAPRRRSAVRSGDGPDRTTTAAPAATPSSAGRLHLPLLVMLAAITILLVIQIIVSTMLLGTERQSRDTAAQTHQFQLCEAQINITATSQTQANTMLKACIAAK